MRLILSTFLFAAAALTSATTASAQFIGGVVDYIAAGEDYILTLESTAGVTPFGRSVALDPMNGRDRRALHGAVRSIEDVITMSVGTGRYRQVVIVPEGAPEYEEAERAAREAEERDSDRSR